MRKLAVLFVLFAVWLLPASSSNATQQYKMFGVMDDNPVMGLAAKAGFGAVKKTIWFSPMQWHWESIDKRARDQLTTDMNTAQAEGISVILELYPVIKYGPPKGSTQQRNTCMLAKDLLDQFPNTFGIEIGVEPNSFTFWKPQFNPDGTQASAAPYERWLATCYDILKASHPDTLVIGGSLSSRGEDDPYKPGSGTSPTLFLQKFCEAFKASGRQRPLMDWLDMHSYPNPEDQDPSVQHPDPSTTITIADYTKLDRLLGCFDGTAQPKPPILWGESGYNTKVPDDQKWQYQGRKPASVSLVDEATQGRYVAKQIQMAYCQPDSVGFINLHMVDDPNLKRNWQSGLLYATGNSAKKSLGIVQGALASAGNATTTCG